MDNKCILVTGSSSGIGRSIVIKLLETGARVIGLARDHSKFKLKNKNYLTYNVDLNDFDSLKKIMIKIIRENNQINGLISNAGYGEFGPLENFSIEKINSFIALNLTSHIVITKLLLL
jgi:short-subunit dehydrogenase